MSTGKQVCVYYGEALASYNFGESHPFGPLRLHAFWERANSLNQHEHVCICEPVKATREVIERFHNPDYVQRVIDQSKEGCGYLDYGDTPACQGIYEAACYVVGSGVDAVDRVMRGDCLRTFIPIGGLHHARRDRAAGFCVFNDCGIVIETLRRQYGIERIAYVDIDAHHGDGVFYAFESDPQLCFVDLHEDGRYLYPGTGTVEESGTGKAQGTKLNIPVAPGANDRTFMAAWPEVESFVRHADPEFILLQCGADSIAGDPITHLAYSPAVHAHVATQLCHLADQLCAGRLIAFGGGGYDLDNLAGAWTAVIASLIDAT